MSTEATLDIADPTNPIPNHHSAHGHIHRPSYGGDGCLVCDDLAIAEIDARLAKRASESRAIDKVCDVIRLIDRGISAGTSTALEDGIGNEPRNGD